MSFNTGLLTQSLLSLVVILALIFGLLYVTRWFAKRRPLGKRRMRFVEAMALGSKEKLVVVKVDHRQLLLGVASQRITLLAELEDGSDSRGLLMDNHDHEATE